MYVRQRGILLETLLRAYTGDACKLIVRRRFTGFCWPSPRTTPRTGMRQRCATAASVPRSRGFGCAHTRVEQLHMIHSRDAATA